MKKLLLFLLIFECFSCNRSIVQEISPTSAKPIKHSVLSNVLEKYVDKDGNVDYKNIAKDDQFFEYLETLKKTHPDSSWTQDERMAYWINAYNAFTIKLIIDHYPVKSIKDIPNRWANKFISIEGKKYSLEEIEHQILRKLYKEPRIHFAINCASYSCPKLLNKSFEAESLDKQLDSVARDFVNDKRRNIISADRAQVSQIFKWFKEDFTSTSSLKEYIQKYSEVTMDQATKIEYLEYKWELNEFSP